MQALQILAQMFQIAIDTFNNLWFNNNKNVIKYL